MNQPEGSVTRLLARLNVAGETPRDADDAARLLWQRYFKQLVGRARSRLAASRLGAGDEEDVALSAFKSVWIGITDGRFPDLSDRNDLWRLLLVVTARKAINHVRAELTDKRGGGRVFGLDDEVLSRIVVREPTPEDAFHLAEECRRLLSSLPDPQLRRIALLKMEGNSDREVGEALGLGLRTVERKLAVIRAVWSDGAPDAT